ncbi:MAG: hypothetical protein JNL02_14935 [Saprospiraceae bacterium]|nr:hypothetical protein [Saprospiraceae bacterium]
MKLLAAFLLCCLPFCLSAQDDGADLLAQLGGEPTTDLVQASFKTSRIVNGHSIENTPKGVLDFRIAHRFSPARRGLYDLFGLDGASVRIGLDYGITDRLAVGIGRNSREKLFDGYLKYRLLRQSTGKKRMPVSLSYYTDIQVKTIEFTDPNRTNLFTSRLFFTHQVLIARKFNDRLTLQLSPTLVHLNLVPSRADRNDVYALGIGGRIKLTRRVTLNAEYYYVPEGQLSQSYTHPLAIGFDIETGGHVFQLHFTNAADMAYKGLITQTDEKWFSKDGNGKMQSGVRFGFNLSRVFTIRK